MLPTQAELERERQEKEAALNERQRQSAEAAYLQVEKFAAKILQIHELALDREQMSASFEGIPADKVIAVQFTLEGRDFICHFDGPVGKKGPVTLQLFPLYESGAVTIRQSD